MNLIVICVTGALGVPGLQLHPGNMSPDIFPDTRPDNIKWQQ